MKFRVLVPRTVQKQLRRLPKSIRARMEKRIQELADDPRPPDCIKLAGYANQYRVRIGVYRIRYAIYDDELAVMIISAAHRKDVYRD